MFLAFLIFDPNWPFCKDYSLCIGYNLSKISNFQNGLLSQFFGVFRAAFCTDQLYCSRKIVFRIFLAILIFYPNWSFFKGYNLCMCFSFCKMADFQNGLISPIIVVFWIGFFHKATLMFLSNRFSHVFGIFNFWPKLTILQRL